MVCLFTLDIVYVFLVINMLCLLVSEEYIEYASKKVHFEELI